MEDRPIIVDKKKAYFDMREDGIFKEDSSHHYHGMGIDGFLEAMDILHDPEYVIREEMNNGDAHFTFISTNEEGYEVCVAFQIAVYKPEYTMNGFPNGYYNLDITEFVATDEWLEEHGVEPGTSYKDYLLSFPGNSIAYDRSIHSDQLKKARIIDSESAGVAASYDNNRAFDKTVPQTVTAVKEKDSSKRDTRKFATRRASAINRMTETEIQAVQSIGRKSVSHFSSADIKATERFAKRYWQEMGAKSPFFRSWFGDWRANDQTKVRIANKKGDTRGVQQNTDTGWDVQVSGQVFAESKHFAKKNKSAMLYLPYINDIVEKAVLLDSYGIDFGKAKSQNSLLMHSLYAIADIGHGPELLKLYVEEMNDPNSSDTAKRAYQLQNIEKASAVNGGVQGNTPSSLANTTNAIRTVADLFAAVKQKDQSFNPGQGDGSLVS